MGPFFIFLFCNTLIRATSAATTYRCERSKSTELWRYGLAATEAWARFWYRYGRAGERAIEQVPERGRERARANVAQVWVCEWGAYVLSLSLSLSPLHTHSLTKRSSFFNNMHYFTGWLVNIVQKQQQVLERAGKGSNWKEFFIEFL